MRKSRPTDSHGLRGPNKRQRVMDKMMTSRGRISLRQQTFLCPHGITAGCIVFMQISCFRFVAFSKSSNPATIIFKNLTNILQISRNYFFQLNSWQCFFKINLLASSQKPPFYAYDVDVTQSLLSWHWRAGNL